MRIQFKVKVLDMFNTSFPIGNLQLSVGKFQPSNNGRCAHKFDEAVGTFNVKTITAVVTVTNCFLRQKVKLNTLTIKTQIHIYTCWYRYNFVFIFLIIIIYFFRSFFLVYV